MELSVDEIRAVLRLGHTCLFCGGPIVSGVDPHHMHRPTCRGMIFLARVAEYGRLWAA